MILYWSLHFSGPRFLLSQVRPEEGPWGAETEDPLPTSQAYRTLAAATSALTHLGRSHMRKQVSAPYPGLHVDPAGTVRVAREAPMA